MIATTGKRKNRFVSFDTLASTGSVDVFSNEKVVYETNNNGLGKPSGLAVTAVVIGLRIGETADPLPQCAL